MSQMIKLPQQEMSVEALKRLIAEAEARKPMEGQAYHLGDIAGNNYYVFSSGTWCEFWKHNRTETHSPNMHWPSRWWAEGRLVPYIPPPPTFQVGQWVAVIAGYSKLKGTTYRVEEYSNGGISLDGCWFIASELRLATPEEIADATRITPKVGMLLKRKNDGAVFRVYGKNYIPEWAHTERLVPPDYDGSAVIQLLEDVTTERYDVLDSYTIQGVR